MIYLIIVGSIFATAILYRCLRRPVANSSKEILVTREFPLRQSFPRNADQKFRGKRLIPAQDCCMAAETISQITLSLQDQISLPLTGCDRATCLCDTKIVHERRTAERRETEDRRSEIRFDRTNQDRRQLNGRRKEDKIWSGGYAG